MEIFEVLKKINKIRPDEEYSRKSKLGILSTLPNEPSPNVFRLVAVSGMRFGSALVLTGIVIFMILGGFSIKGSPEGGLVSGLDLRGLRAEAQAIDIQIELTNLAYESVENPAATNTNKTSGFSKTTHKTTGERAIANGETTIPTSSSLAVPEATMDQALDFLSQ